jgi:hypothetical protein
MSELIKHENGSHSFSIPKSAVEKLGSRLVLINLDRIKNYFETMVKHYPVKAENLPVLKDYVNIQSKTLPNTYVVCSETDFKEFVDGIKNNVDLITRSDYLANNKINSYHFEV